MLLRKFRPKQLFDGEKFWPSGSVLITDNLGKVLEIIPGQQQDQIETLFPSEGEPDIENLEGILLPGWVNTHCHLELSFLQGEIPENTGLVGFLTTVIQRRNALLQQGKNNPISVNQVKHEKEKENQKTVDSYPVDSYMEKIQEAMKLADEAMWKRGISVVGDVCNSAVSADIKASSSIQYVNFIEAAGFQPNDALSRFHLAQSTAAIFKEKNLTHTLVPHAPYSCSPELLRLLYQDHQQKHALAVPSTIHHQESEAENNFFINKSGPFLALYEFIQQPISFFSGTGKSSVHWWLKEWRENIHQNAAQILVHNLATSDEDLNTLMDQFEQGNLNPFWCCCAGANFYIQREWPQPLQWIKAVNERNGDRGKEWMEGQLTIGTDSLASNTTLDIWQECCWLMEHAQLPLELVLKMGTLNGAKALGVSDEFGKIAVNKKPGLVLLTGRDSKRIL